MNPDLKRIIDGITILCDNGHQEKAYNDFVENCRGSVKTGAGEKSASYHPGPVDRLAYGYMKKIAGSRVNIEDAKEASNDFFLKVNRYPPEPTFLKAWVWMALTDACKNILQKNYKMTFIGTKGQKEKLKKCLEKCPKGESKKSKIISTMIQMLEDLKAESYVQPESLLSLFLAEKLPPRLIEKVRVHIGECVFCQSEFDRLFLEGLEKNSLELPLIEISETSESFVETFLEEAISRKAENLLFSIRELNGFYRREEILFSIGEKLKERRESFYRLPLVATAMLDLETLKKREETFILVDDAPRFSNLEYLFAEAKKPVIATGSYLEWANSEITTNHKDFTFIEPPRDEEINRIEEEAKLSCKQYSSEEFWKAFIYVCALGRFNLPTSSFLVARMIDRAETDSDWIIKAGEGKGLFRRVSEDPILLLPKNEYTAEKVLAIEFKEKKEEELEQIYKLFFKNAASEDASYLVKLIHILYLRSKKKMARQIVKEDIETLSSPIFDGLMNRFGLAKVSSNLKLFDEAEGFFKQALEIDSENKYVRHVYAKMLGESKNYEEAEKIFKDLAKDNPNSIYILQAWGNMEAKGGWSFYIKAKKRFEKAHKIDPDNIYTLVAWGNLEAKWRHYEAAKKQFDNALNIEEKNLFALNSYGVMEANRLNYDKANDDFFEKVFKIDPKNIPTINAKGKMEKDRGHLKEAEEQFSKALSIDPENLHSLNALAEIMIERKDFDSAEKLLEGLLDLDPRNIQTYVAYGNMEVKKEGYEKAEKLFEEAVKIDKENVYVYISRANMMVGKKPEPDYAQAEKLFEKALENSSNPIEKIVTYNNIAKMWADRKDVGGARYFIEKSRELLTDNRLLESLEGIVTLNTWAEIEGKDKNYPEAEKLYQKTLVMDQDNAYTHLAYAKMLKKAKRKEESKIHLKKAKGLGLEIPEVLKMLKE